MDPCSGTAVIIEFYTGEQSAQHHLRALWESEVIEFEFLLQCDKSNPLAGRRCGWLGIVGEMDSHEFGEGHRSKDVQIPDRNHYFRCKTGPRICVQRLGVESSMFLKDRRTCVIVIRDLVMGNVSYS